MATGAAKVAPVRPTQPKHPHSRACHEDTNQRHTHVPMQRCITFKPVRAGSLTGQWLGHRVGGLPKAELETESVHGHDGDGMPAFFLQKISRAKTPKVAPEHVPRQGLCGWDNRMVENKTSILAARARSKVESVRRPAVI